MPVLLPVALNYKLQLLCRWNTRTKGKDKLTEWKEEQGREKGEQVRKKRGRARECSETGTRNRKGKIG